MSDADQEILCGICKLSGGDQFVTCSTCKASFHKSCVHINDSMVTWMCSQCVNAGSSGLQVPPAPRSRRSVSIRSKRSSHGSRHSMVLDQELRKLEEERIALHKSIDEKAEVDKRFIQRKYELLNAASECSSESSSKNSVRSKEKVESWIAAQQKPTQPIRNVQTGLKTSHQFLPKETMQFSDPTALNSKTVILSSTTNPIVNLQEVPSLTKNAISARNVVSKELPEFDGNPRHWAKFISTFETSTQLCQMQQSENALRLQKCLKGKAYKAVENMLFVANNVDNVIDTLRTLFGRPEFIINELLDDLRRSPKPKHDDIVSIIEYAQHVENVCSTMKAASLSDHLWNPILLQELVDFLPMNIRLEWAAYKYSAPSANLEVFGMWLKQQSKILVGLLRKAPFQNQLKGRCSVNVHNESDERKCFECSGSCQDLEVCSDFQNKNYFERWETINKCKLCRTCLKKHFGRRCMKKKICGVNNCEKLHHPLLHNPKDTSKSSENFHENNSSEVVNLHNASKAKTLFKIIPVTVSANGKSVQTYAMLDDGCSLTLVHHSISNYLNLTGRKQPLCLKWTTNIKRDENDSMVVSFDITGTNGKQFSFQNVRTVELLNLPQQTVEMDELRRDFSYLNDLPLPTYYNADPKILIGLTHAKHLVNTKIRSRNYDEPIAAKYKLGWTIFGSQICNEAPVFHICECKARDKYLDDTLKKYFEIENLGISSSQTTTVSKDERKALDLLELKTVLKNRYFETGLLWKFKNVKLPDSYDMALNRLRCLQKRCVKDSNLADIIQNQIDEYLRKGYARKLSESEILKNSDCWYLPIFAVKNPNKPQKIRIVWDAAAKVQGVSLNNVLLKGPDNLASLPAILRRFREGRFAVTGDIQEMFHQVRIKEEDQHFQRFLWSPKSTEQPIIYVMCVMTFGSSCSPATAQFVKNKNAERFSEKFPEAVFSIIHNHYVDDFLDSTDTVEEAVELSKRVKFIHNEGGFHIRHWTSNSKIVLENLEDPVEVGEKSLELHQDHSIEFEKVLGLWWNTKNDCFTYSLKLNKANSNCLTGESIPSKREILRAVMSVFDPLGFLSHFLIFPRILLQDIWRAGHNWDDPINVEHNDRWREWVACLPCIEKLQIPRWLHTKKRSTIELHTFVDASEEAYAAAVYARQVVDGSVRCCLMSAKSRVSPLKPISVPRLELLAATIGTRLAISVKNDVGLNVSRMIFWSDSRTVLSWIKSDARKYKQFVGFRVAEILEKTSADEWRWVPTTKNIADLATRKKVVDVVYESAWFTGPDFLYEPEVTWPGSSISPDTTEEMRPKHLVSLNFHDELKIERFSNFQRVRRTQAFVLRFIKNLKIKCGHITSENVQIGPISKAEYQSAQNCLFRKAQAEGYPDEVACFDESVSLPVSKDSPIFKDIPFKDEFGILRASTRLAFDEVTPFDVKFPVLLPKDHSITILLLKFYHYKYHHINAETAVNEVSQRFVVPTLRTILRKIHRDCQWCKNKLAKPYPPRMSTLPVARTTSFTRPFSYVGVDCFGPLYVTVKRSQEKRWGVLFTCLSIRAIHIEITSNLSTDNFILSLECFINRRGMPLEIFCDNGTNFKGASNELMKEIENLNKNRILEMYNSDCLQFNFNPPSAPHFGGAWERLVRSIKTTLKAVSPLRTPTDDLLKSLMAQVEMMVNSRPLTYIPISSENEEPLTPNHFLLGTSSGYKPLGMYSENCWIHRKNWLKSQEYADRLWKRWRSEYLPHIRRRSKWFLDHKDLSVGDIVLMVDDDMPRNLWPKAKVISVSTSRDGRVRKATIQSSKGIYDRPVVKLARLDVLPKDCISPDTSIYRGGVLREGETEMN